MNTNIFYRFILHPSFILYFSIFLSFCSFSHSTCVFTILHFSLQVLSSSQFQLHFIFLGIIFSIFVSSFPQSVITLPRTRNPDCILSLTSFTTSIMSLRTMTFGPIGFSSTTLDKLSLHAKYEVAIRLPSGKLESLSVDECLKALTSGEIWVSSGNSCRIDLSITVDGRELVETNDNHIVESLGKFVAESKVCGINTRRNNLHAYHFRYGNSLDYPRYSTCKMRYYRRNVFQFSSTIMNPQPCQLSAPGLGHIQLPMLRHLKHYFALRWNDWNCA